MLMWSKEARPFHTDFVRISLAVFQYYGNVLGAKVYLLAGFLRGGLGSFHYMQGHVSIRLY